MDYIEVNFEIEPLHPFDDILIAELADLGFESFVTCESGIQAYIPQNVYDSSCLVTLINQYNSSECKITFNQKMIPAQNWNAVGKAILNRLM